MKKTFTLVTTLLLSASLFAFGPQTKLIISNNSRYQLSVVVDGRNYNTDGYANGNGDIVINDPQAGVHSIRISQQNDNRKRRGIFSKNNQAVLFNSNINVKPQYRTHISINSAGNIELSEQRMGRAATKRNGNYDNDRNDRDYNNDNGNYGDRGNGGYNQPMNGRTFDQLKYSINSASYDNSKLSVAKQAIAANYFSAAQVKELVQLFSYENSKLDIAKYSYTYTLDKQNYFVVNDAFNYASSKEELARYLQQRR
ncbi:MAG: DUF4476 domain-containing protein [Ferruginibacter sp.]